MGVGVGGRFGVGAVEEEEEGLVLVSPIVVDLGRVGKSIDAW